MKSTSAQTHEFHTDCWQWSRNIGAVPVMKPGRQTQRWWCTLKVKLSAAQTMAVHWSSVRDCDGGRHHVVWYITLSEGCAWRSRSISCHALWRLFRSSSICRSNCLVSVSVFRRVSWTMKKKSQVISARGRRSAELHNTVDISGPANRHWSQF